MFSHHFFEVNTSETFSLLRKLGELFAMHSGPVKDQLLQLVRTDDYRALVDYEIDYAQFSDPTHVVAARQCLALFQKAEFLPLGVDRERVAYAKFLESEVQCSKTNARLINYRAGNCDPRVEPILYLAQRKIARLLGDVPTLDELDLTFGPGASTSCVRRTTARWKLSAEPSCSTDMLPAVKDVLQQLPLYSQLHFSGADGHRSKLMVCSGKLMFVPKNAKTYRSICVEPTLNGMVQRGIGSYLKRRLLSAGVNLYSQERNQQLAQLGMIAGLSTIDLSSASDTISIELVRDLLPPDWFEFLSTYRTGRVRYKDKMFCLEKFSSMGNGFTFELETLIFWALVESICSHYKFRVKQGRLGRVISVYGDDIVCPFEAYDKTVELFELVGFRVNEAKSYKDGPFRESCGKDFFLGEDVRPVYIKEALSSFEIARLYNFFWRRRRDQMFPGLLEVLIERVPPSNRLIGPDGYGDGHFCARQFYRRPYKRNLGWSGYTFETFVRKSKRLKGTILGDRVLPFYWIYTRDPDSFDPPEHYSVRGSAGYNRRRIYVLA